MSFVNFDISEGMVLEKLFQPRSMLVREALRAEICEGTEPVILLLKKYNVLRFVNFDISEGMVLERQFKPRSMFVKVLLRAEICEGTEPVRLFSPRYSIVSFDSKKS